MLVSKEKCNWQEGAVREMESCGGSLSHQAAARRQGPSVFVGRVFIHVKSSLFLFSLPFCGISFVHLQAEEEMELYPQPWLARKLTGMFPLGAAELSRSSCRSLLLSLLALFSFQQKETPYGIIMQQAPDSPLVTCKIGSTGDYWQETVSLGASCLVSES